MHTYSHVHTYVYTYESKIVLDIYIYIHIHRAYTPRLTKPIEGGERANIDLKKRGKYLLVWKTDGHQS